MILSSELCSCISPSGSTRHAKAARCDEADQFQFSGYVRFEAANN
jgi:hypothetical protein